MRLLFFELTIALVFLFLSVGICWMAWALPIGLAPTFSVSSGAFPFLLGVILLLLSVWWTLDLLGQIRRDKREHPQGRETRRS